jgi:hypothetical protein
MTAPPADAPAASLIGQLQVGVLAVQSNERVPLDMVRTTTGLLTGLALAIVSAVATWAQEATTEPTVQPSEELSAEQSSPKEVHADWTRDVLANLQTYCGNCHSGGANEGEFAFDTFVDVQSARQEPHVWRKARELIEFGAMPPEGEPPIPVELRRELALWLRSLVEEHAASDGTLASGHVTLRRLNRAEYNNTIRDLLAVDFAPAAEFPSDEVGAGFDNNGDVLSISPLLLEKYVSAAERVAERVIKRPDEFSQFDEVRAADQLVRDGAAKLDVFSDSILEAGGEVRATFRLEYPGSYAFRLDGWTPPLKFEGADRHRGLVLGLFLSDGRELGRFIPKENGEWYRDTERTIELPSGDVTLIVRGMEPAEAPAGVAEEAGNPPIAKAALKQVRLSGPKALLPVAFPESHLRFVTAHPDQGLSPRDAARMILKPFLRRAFRGPVDDETVERYVDLIPLVIERKGTFEKGLEVAIAAVLTSPRFLFRAEPRNGTVTYGANFPLTDHQLATRLAYFLWSSTPDDQLLDLADAGLLRDSQRLYQEVDRMLDDPRSDALAENFAAQWLGLRNLRGLTPSAEQAPEFDEELRVAMREETLRLFLEAVRTNRSVLDLLDSGETFVNERLARHYGIEGISGPEFRKVTVAGSGRRGLLTQASFLTLTSNPTRTSPVKRGKWIMENILGMPPPEPPAGVPTLEESNTGRTAASLREQLAIHRTDPACASCHHVMDALGLGFENYDLTGQWRKDVQGQPIDASGELPDGATFNGPDELIDYLKRTAGEQFATVLTERLMTFALGRQLRVADRELVEQLVRGEAAEGYPLKDLIKAVVVSEPFTSQEADVTGETL